MRTLNIIGGGNVGKTLGRLWTETGFFEVQDILNRSLESANRAAEFMGAGRAAGSYEDLRPADLYMISTSDNSIVECCNNLAHSGRIHSGAVVFHCSGAVVSSELSSAVRRGAFVASVHPVKSFADPTLSVKTFGGTYCGVEGDTRALEILRLAFETIGAQIFEIDPEFKTIYHSGTVIVCNYLIALLEVGIRAYVRSGIPRATALKLMEPIVRETVDNVFRLDTARALTGPIARGDHSVVSRQHEALIAWDEEIGELYKALGRFALKLSRSQGNARPEDLAVLSKLLGEQGEKA